MSFSPSDFLHLHVEIPAEVSAGDVVPVALHVENVATRPLDLYLRGREIAFDIVVTDARGIVVWRRLADAIIPAIIQLRTLAPGEVLELRDNWDQRSASGSRVLPGDYRVVGALLTEQSDPLQTPGTLVRILER